MDDQMSRQTRFTATLRTLAGSEHRVEDVTADTSIHEIKVQLAKQLKANAFSLKLLVGAVTLDAGTLGDAGVTAETPLLLIRVPGQNEDYRRLFWELRDALRDRCGDEARRLLELGAGFDAEGNLLKEKDLDKEEATGVTALNLAVRVGLVDLAQYIIHRDEPEEINHKNEMGRTPLCQAAAKRLTGVVDALLEKRADLNVADHNRCTALRYAMAITPDDGIAAALVKAGAVAELEFSPVLSSCLRDLPLTALSFLERDAEWRGHDGQGRTALHYAYGFDMAEVIAVLVEKGASHEVHDMAGWEPRRGISPSLVNCKFCWMWADTGCFVNLNPLRWSSSKNILETIKELKAYAGSARPVLLHWAHPGQRSSATTIAYRSVAEVIETLKV